MSSEGMRLEVLIPLMSRVPSAQPAKKWVMVRSYSSSLHLGVETCIIRNQAFQRAQINECQPMHMYRNSC